jgi:hypothetical protein
MRSDGETDQWVKWKQARLQSWRQAKPVYVLLVAAFLVLLGLAVRGAEPWAAMALSTTFIPFGAELTCYYYSFIIMVVLLSLRSERLGERLLLLTAFTQFVAWAPFKGMPTWLDEQYTLMSVATIAIFVVIVWEFFRKRSLAMVDAPDFAFVVDARQDASATAEETSARGGARNRARRARRRR